MSAHEALREWYRLADQLIAASSHAELAEAARILALKLHTRRRSAFCEDRTSNAKSKGRRIRLLQRT
jgi:hypothetical protein